MVPSAFSGPRLAPPISDTAETTATPGTRRGSTCPSFRSANKPGTCSGRRVSRRSKPTTTPAAAVTATHHHCPPNQPGWASTYHRPPNPITPMNTRPANAPNTPSTTAYPISTQNSRFWVTGGTGAPQPPRASRSPPEPRRSGTPGPPPRPGADWTAAISKTAPRRTPARHAASAAPGRVRDEPSMSSH